MARIIDTQFPSQHAGIVRVSNGLAALRGLDQVFTQAVLGGLSIIGAPVSKRLAAWADARKQRIEDRKLWDMAQQDARVMADLSRAMSRDALRDTRYY